MNSNGISSSSKVAVKGNQQQERGKGAATGVLHVPVGKRRVSWTDEVDSPRNKYRMHMTHEGTASGHPNKLPPPR